MQVGRQLLIQPKSRCRPIPARQASPKLPVARTRFFRVQRLRSSRSWLPGPGHYRSVGPRVQSWPRRAPERQVYGDESTAIFGWTRPFQPSATDSFRAAHCTFSMPAPATCQSLSISNRTSAGAEKDQGHKRAKERMNLNDCGGLRGRLSAVSVHLREAAPQCFSGVAAGSRLSRSGSIAARRIQSGCAACPAVQSLARSASRPRHGRRRQ